jgi:hypothetical protein
LERDLHRAATKVLLPEWEVVPRTMMNLAMTRLEEIYKFICVLDIFTELTNGGSYIKGINLNANGLENTDDGKIEVIAKDNQNVSLA